MSNVTRGDDTCPGSPGSGARRAVPALIALPLVVASLLVASVPVALAAADVEVTTPYPAVAVAPGEEVSFDLSVTTDVADRVDLAVQQVPEGWTATIRGEGFVVDGVQTNGDDPVEVTLDVTVPADAAAGSERIVVAAESGPASDTLAIDVRVEEGAAGEVTLTTDFPELRGAADQDFEFNLTLANDTADQLTFGLAGEGPAGWQVTAQPSGEAQAASAVVDAGADATINVTATAPAGVEAGRYPVRVVATSPEHTVEAELAVEVTGSYEMTLTTPDGRLNTRGTAGSVIEQQVAVQNTGTAAIEELTLEATAPSGWEVVFDPPALTVAPNTTETATARITPSGDAIAGDYVVTISGSNDEVDGEFDLRVTVETSLLWGLVGVAIIVLVVAGLAWVFRRYGRR